MSKSTVDKKLKEKLEPLVSLFGEEFLVDFLSMLAKPSPERSSYRLKVSAIYSVTTIKERSKFYKAIKTPGQNLEFPFSNLTQDDITQIRKARSTKDTLNSNIKYIVSESH